jgi:hypothetical protein
MSKAREEQIADFYTEFAGDTKRAESGEISTLAALSSEDDPRQILS